MLQFSIHPRVYHGNDSKKKNTMKTKDPSVTARKINHMKAHLELHPKDYMTLAHLKKLGG